MMVHQHFISHNFCFNLLDICQLRRQPYGSLNCLLNYREMVGSKLNVAMVVPREKVGKVRRPQTHRTVFLLPAAAPAGWCAMRSRWRRRRKLEKQVTFRPAQSCGWELIQLGRSVLTFGLARRSLQKWKRGALWISRGVLLSNPAWFPTVAHLLFLPQSHEWLGLQVQTAVCAQDCVRFQRPPLYNYDVLLKILQKNFLQKNARCQFCDQ